MLCVSAALRGHTISTFRVKYEPTRKILLHLQTERQSTTTCPPLPHPEPSSEWARISRGNPTLYNTRDTFKWLVLGSQEGSKHKRHKQTHYKGAEVAPFVIQTKGDNYQHLTAFCEKQPVLSSFTVNYYLLDVGYWIFIRFNESLF